MNDLLRTVDDVIETLQPVMRHQPIPPLQPGTPYDDVWIAYQGLLRAQKTMAGRRQQQLRMRFDGQVK